VRTKVLYTVIRKEKLEALLQEIQDLKLALKEQKRAHLESMVRKANQPQECQHEPVEGWNDSISPPPCKKCGLVVY
jgi:hypothetical protein